jgi:hypothetical protein
LFFCSPDASECGFLVRRWNTPPRETVCFLAGEPKSLRPKSWDNQ